MASTPIRLDVFPTEIIQRIASFSSCESVLALLKVNRQLYKACNNALVFRSIIKNGNGHGVSTPWNCALISHHSSTSSLARLALADSRARTWLITTERHPDQDSLGNGPASSSGRLSNREGRGNVGNVNVGSNLFLSKWAPQLAALHHPVIMEGNLKLLFAYSEDELYLVSQNSHHPADIVPINFFATATVLYSCWATVRYQGSVKSDLRADVESVTRDIINVNAWNQSAETESLLSFALAGIRDNFFRRIPPPSPYKIPFQSIFNLPIPFSQSLQGNSHLRVATSIPFLEDGEWVGYYTYSLTWHRNRFDPPMEGIRFTADHQAGAHHLHASGMDNVGHFLLTGSVASTGQVSMRKTYAQGFSWEWVGNMTPFGIFGTWGRHDSPHGYFWLWKREWCEM